jgi:hypothetical protein
MFACDLVLQESRHWGHHLDQLPLRCMWRQDCDSVCRLSLLEELFHHLNFLQGFLLFENSKYDIPLTHDSRSLICKKSELTPSVGCHCELPDTEGKIKVKMWKI